MSKVLLVNSKTFYSKNIKRQKKTNNNKHKKKRIYTHMHRQWDPSRATLCYKLSFYFCLILFEILSWDDLRANKVYESFNLFAKIHVLWRMCNKNLALLMVNTIGALSILFATPSPTLKLNLRYCIIFDRIDYV